MRYSKCDNDKLQFAKWCIREKKRILRTSLTYANWRRGSTNWPNGTLTGMPSKQDWKADAFWPGFWPIIEIGTVELRLPT